jgi:hypothetical protein
LITDKEYKEEYHFTMVRSSLSSTTNTSLESSLITSAIVQSFLSRTTTVQNSPSDPNSIHDNEEDNNNIGSIHFLSSTTTVQNAPSDPNSIHDNEEDNNNIGSLHLNNPNWLRTCIGDKATTLNGTIQNGECKKTDGKEKRLKERNHLRALCSEGQYKDEVDNAEEGMFQEPIPIKDTSYSNTATTDIPSLDYNLVIILIYGHVILMKRLCLCLCLCLIILIYGHVIPMIRLCLCLCFSIVTLNRVCNVLGQSMGSVKTHTGLMNRTSQMRARLEARLELLVNRISRIMSHLGHPREPSNPAYRVTYLYVLPYLSLYVLSYLRKHDYKYGSYRIDYSIGMKE